MLQPSANNIKFNQIDYFVFHQANKFMLEGLTRAMNLDKKKRTSLNYKLPDLLERNAINEKTWEIINEIRGKSKKSMKPQFSVNGVRITERRIF